MLCDEVPERRNEQVEVLGLVEEKISPHVKTSAAHLGRSMVRHDDEFDLTHCGGRAHGAKDPGAMTHLQLDVENDDIGPQLHDLFYRRLLGVCHPDDLDPSR